jgi:type IV pilus assembly protein PilN
VIRINLLSVRETKREAGRRNETRIAALAAALVVASLISVEVISRMRLAPIVAEHEQLVQEVKVLETKTAELTELEKQKTDLDDRIKTIELLEQKKVGPVHILANLSDATPEKVWLIEFTENGGAATITGFALDNQTIATFMRNLAGSKFFNDVDLVETTQAEQNGGQVKRFVVRARLSYAGTPVVASAPDEAIKFPEPPRLEPTMGKPKKAKGA